MAVGDSVEVDVERVAHGGFCVARLDGRAVFVRHALPGERVRAVVTEERPRYLRADAVEVLVASAHRVQEPCPYARPGRCGGCDWQHVEIGHQRALKATVVAEQLRRIAGLDRPVVVEEVPGHPDGLGWRTRVQWAVRRDGAVGLHRHRSHAVQPIERCLIAHPEVTAVGVERRPWPHVRRVEVVTAAATGERAVVVTPVSRRQPVRPMDLDAPAAVLRDDGGGATTALRGSAAVTELAAGRRWRVSGSGFWQVHPAAADALAGAVLELAGARPGDAVLDLYCGAGLFAGALGEAVGDAGRVVAVEADRAAAADAAHNLADLSHVRVERCRVDAGSLPRLAGLAGRPVDVVVLDPPRAGAGIPLAQAIGALGARAVVHVACDPASLARDIAALAGAGYRLERLRAFDLFPMTAHVECVALLTTDGYRSPCE
ncbi:MAG: class I SAM-dependent RNA methyltransferase [Frankiaceae bacterium]